MVELCELPVMDCEEWPPDMDTHVAELDFARSVEESIFSSLDPQAISTDSLDTSLLHRRCANNKEDYRLTLLEDSGQWTASTAPLTTWGRIRSTEPLEETTTSMPLPVAATLPRQSKTRPTSLLATFQGFAPFVDVNENEMTAVDSASSPTRKTAADRWRQATRCRATPRRRTFAQLSEAPRLDFLALPHEMPELCEPELSLGEAMQRLKEGSLTGFERLPTCLLAEDSPDSGLGSSGPSHIEDWPSLALLLPRHVVEACSFFKSHSRLLASNCNSIERSSEACRTCFGVRRRLHPPAWAHAPSSRHLCDCGAEVEERGVCASPSLHTGELSIVGLPVYSEKRRLVETAVEGAAEMARGGSTADLVAALWKLIGDGLSPSRHVWEVISAGTAPGPATKGVHALVAELDSSEKSLNSRVDLFFQELLRLGLLDCWLCYIVLKDSSLRPFYSESAFLPKASTAYHSLLCRLVESLQLLAIFPPSTPRSLYSSASRLPSDSRVPKSSSMPARLSCSQWRRPSRIPRLRERPEWPRKTSQGPSGHGRMSEAKALRDSSEPGFLSVSSGESLRVLSFRGPLARVCRSRPRRDAVSTGLLPIANLSLV